MKDNGLPDLPRGVPADDVHMIANILHSAALRLLRRARAADVGMDLDGPRASALSVLVFGGPTPIGQLARVEQVSAPAITKTVAALEASGLVERVRSGQDRRIVLVRATALGRAVLERGRAARVRVVAELIRDCGDRDLVTLRRAAQVVGDLLAAPGPAARPDGNALGSEGA